MATLEIPQKLAIDTTVLVNYLRSGSPASLGDLADNGQVELATTIINVFELYLGVYRSKDIASNLAAVKGLTSTLRVLGLTEETAERAGQVMAVLQKSGKPIEMRDLLIGSTCLEYGFAILTDNMAHFDRIPNLQVITEHRFLNNLRTSRNK